MAGARELCHDSVVTTTVLIVDDHPSFRASARALLQAEGFEVVGEAEDGARALQAVEELRPDVVLLDVQLPDLDGFEVAR
jgi:DNA-binding NarL/FixJ family response regulator